jgi:parvulin-like peptidyl-prolyl isomerase
MQRIPTYLAGALVLALAGNAAGAETAAVAPFARIGAAVITQQDFDAALALAARAKFYHGKPQQQDIALLQREVGAQLVSRALLLREAGRRQLKPDAIAIAASVKNYDQRYADSAQWKAQRETMLAPLVARLEQDNVLAQLEALVRATAAPGPAAVLAYYKANPAKFTEPEQLHVAVILFKVDPSSPAAQWIKADQQAQAIALRARNGEDFAKLARQYSNDETAARGGDMGYVHLGMLPDGTQAELAMLKAGGTTNSLRLLQGLGVFRLIERKPAQALGFDKVKVRAGELAQRDESQRSWDALQLALRAAEPVRPDESRFLPLAEQANGRPVAR